MFSIICDGTISTVVCLFFINRFHANWTFKYTATYFVYRLHVFRCFGMNPSSLVACRKFIPRGVLTETWCSCHKQEYPTSCWQSHSRDSSWTEMLQIIKSYCHRATSGRGKAPESDGSFFENYTALAWRQENRRLRAASEVSSTSLVPASFSWFICGKPQVFLPLSLSFSLS